MAKTNKKTNNNKIKWKDIANGDFLANFIRNNSLIMLIIIAILILRIANQYHCLKQLTEIDKLQDSINLKREIYLTISKKEMELLRESQIEKKVNDANLSIKPNKTTPYILN